MRKQRLVVIGNGMAGINCVQEILNHQPDAFEIIVFGSEPHYNYNRILLSTVLQGSTKVEDITLNDRSWYEDKNIKLYTGETVTYIDPDNKLLRTDQDREVSYDKAIIATGSHPFVLPILGNDKRGVINFRTIEDCKNIIDMSKHHKKAVVIGGGLLGLEAARGLLHLGMEVDVVHLSKHIMDRQLDPTASIMLQRELESQGVNFLLEKASAEIIGGDSVEGLRFKDGTEVEAEAIIMAVGVRPNINLMKGNRIETNRAIVVNDYLQTNVPDIYAVGECAEHRGVVYGLVKPLYEQGRELAKHICGIDSQGYQGSTLSTQLKISGVDVFSVGDFVGDETTKTITHYDEQANIYKKLVLKDDKILGAVLYGDTKVGNRLVDMINKQKVMTDEEKMLLLQTSDRNSWQVSSMEHTELICNCNGVTKGTILESCQLNNITTVEEIKSCTKASSACGGCKPLVTELLTYIQSEGFDEVIEKVTLCSCTTLTDEELVNELQIRQLRSVDEVMRELGWLTEGGCSTCLSAIQYYLGMIYPEYEKEQPSLFINERMNATMQSDGSFSITPQMYGGLTSAEELRKIADAIEQYNIPQVAITSEQRLTLMGIAQKDLEAIWKKIDLPLSSTYGNTVQNIKTCIGETICTCDKHKALQLAVKIEKTTDYVVTPYRLKMGISACLHNGAGSTTKDVGVIQTDRGWEMYVGGSSGRNVRSGQLLCVADTNKKLYEMVIGFIQYYRETAKYGERSWEWIDRVSLVHIREVLFDDDLRKQLSENLELEMKQRKKIVAELI
ncbi:nitrite reductase large subunit NirB [Alkalihalophilus sp. As8PL]|uniref:Nitrite reductase large subunit NirB n=1 Tax=Alkalihalophilus sp. As8PL TaxID=3237103 RepID=A0AB39BQT7_9BACI